MLRLTELIKVIKVYDSFVLGKCSCGCGNDIPIRSTDKALKKYINHHHAKLYVPKFVKYLKFDSHGYILIRRPYHKFANCDGYVFLHRLVYEKFYNVCLLPYVDIHHIDKNILNNEITNLQPVYNFQHPSYHKKDMSDRYCLLCYSTETYIDKKGIPAWLKHKDGFICSKCRLKLWYRNKKKIRLEDKELVTF